MLFDSSYGRWSLGRTRLFIAAFLFLFSLLAVFQAPTYFLWKLSIIATEWGHLLAILAFVPLLPGWKQTRLGQMGVLFALLAIILLLSPLIRALPVARQLPTDLLSAFGPVSTGSFTQAQPRSTPLDVFDLVQGITVPEIQNSQHVYVSREGIDLTLDLYRSVHGQQPMPVVIVIHGGGWENGDSSQLPSLNTYLANQGFVVAAVNYRLAPRWRFPASAEDIIAALQFLQFNASKFGLDRTRVVLLGRSAGAQLALLTGYTVNDPAVRGVIAFYAPADLHFSFAHPANPLVLDSRRLLKNYLGGSPNDVPKVYDRASPIQLIGTNTPPTLLIHGGRDELVFPVQSERLHRKLDEKGISNLLVNLPWATHGCDANFSGPCGQITTYAIEHFLHRVLKPAES